MGKNGGTSAKTERKLRVKNTNLKNVQVTYLDACENRKKKWYQSAVTAVSQMNHAPLELEGRRHYTGSASSGLNEKFCDSAVFEALKTFKKKGGAQR